MNFILGIYGFLLLAGGFIGYKKAGSKMSLYMGIVSGLLIFVGAYLTTNMSVEPQRSLRGFMLTAVVSGILVIVFIKRLLKTKKFMPLGMLIIVSVLVFIFSILEANLSYKIWVLFQTI